MGVTRETAVQSSAAADERVAQTGPLRRLLMRPEMGAVVGAVAVWIFYAIYANDRGFVSLRATANYLEVSAELGILAVAVALLMIGGEFDLSIGSVIGGCGMILALLSVEYGWNIWLALAASFVFAVLVGIANGYMVLRTGLPSFIITLGTLLIVSGVTTGVTRRVTGRTQVGGLDDVPGYEALRALFASSIGVGRADFAISILWWVGIAALATWVLLRTSFGNWIFGVGGNLQAARNIGVPVGLVKIMLFITTALAGWLVAVIQVLSSKGADVTRGTGREFTAIIAAVIGGTLLTGGYGSAVGAVFGALIYGMVNLGNVYAGVNPGWEEAVLGAMLVIAVMVNRFIRVRAMEAR